MKYIKYAKVRKVKYKNELKMNYNRNSSKVVLVEKLLQPF